MVWGGIATDIKLPLYFFEGTVTAQTYIDALSTTLLPFLEVHGNDDWLFLQDNAPAHTANTTKKFLQDKGIRTANHPPSSPDLNPIENVWSMLSARVYAGNRTFRDLHELRQAVVTAWNEIPQENINAAIASMPNPIAAVLANEGGNTAY